MDSRLLGFALAAACIVACGDSGSGPEEEECDDFLICGDDDEVQTCPSGATCYTVEDCSGRTVLCDSCEPTCPAGTALIRNTICGDAGACTQHRTCGENYVCKGPCGPGTCKPGDTQVDTCPPGITCYEVAGCQDGPYAPKPTTCATSEPCTEMPECDGGDTMTTEPSCVGCYSVTVCGYTIQCIDAPPEH